MKSKLELNKLAYEQFENEISDGIKIKKNEYEKLEIDRLKYMLKKEVDFYIKTDIQDKIEVEKLIQDEEKLKKEINDLEDILTILQEDVKKRWVKENDK